MDQQTVPPRAAPRSARLPLSGLLALAASGFLTATLETMPAGILPAMSAGLGVSEVAAGQTVTVYALGSIAGAIPIISATAGWPRRRLLVMALVGYLATVLVVAVSPSFALTLVARFITGVFAGVMWGILAGYASRMSPPEHRGRGLAIALSGPPVAMAFGTPLGALLASAVGWRVTFLAMAILVAAVLVWVRAVVPDFPGQGKSERMSIARTVRLPGVAAVITASVLLIMGHYALYTYASSVLSARGMAGSVSAFLLTFGVCALLGLWGTGVLVDRHLRGLMVVGVLVLAAGMLGLGLLVQSPVALFLSAAVWGLGFGGAGTAIPQTALTNAAGAAVDTAQAVLVTGWNLGIAAGGVIGGSVVAGIGSGALPFVTLAFLVPVFAIVVVARRHGFPRPGLRISRIGTASDTSPSTEAFS
ncbi:MFS transporter [Nocardia asteroides]|uniref:MFS transporter n=1 Tax=Nocardia asteroides TaxID=1824 RepID=UPI001E31A16E|nr:MFS transporter [Nocardia asteroides]UGT62693.1 MFS transporter [Nocardia asteroides]